MNKSFYAVIPADVRYDKRLKPLARLLYGEITALSNEVGYCWATNKYFSNLYSVTERTVQNLLHDLKECGYIDTSVIYDVKTKEVIERRIVIKNVLRNVVTVDYDTPPAKTECIKEKVFIKPTVEEIQNYCKERNNRVNPEQFYDYYESKGWFVGKSKMKDWKSAVRTWERNSFETKQVTQKVKTKNSVVYYSPEEIEKQKQEDAIRWEKIMKGELDI